MSARCYRLVVVVVLGLFGSVALHAGDDRPAIPFHDGFETQLPGQRPEGWGVTWGTQGDDLFMVTNVEHVGGSRCMVIDRRTGSNRDGWQLGRMLPDVSDGWARLRLTVKIDGPANEARFVIKLTEAHPRTLLTVNVGLRGWGPKLYLYPAVGKTWGDNWKAKKEMAVYRRDTWHRITLYAPTRGNPGEQAWGVVERRDDDGTWTTVGQPARVPGRAPKATYGRVMFDLYGQHRGYMLYVDDVRFDSVEKLPKEFNTQE